MEPSLMADFLDRQRRRAGRGATATPSTWPPNVAYGAAVATEADPDRRRELIRQADDHAAKARGAGRPGRAVGEPVTLRLVVVVALALALVTSCDELVPGTTPDPAPETTDPAPETTDPPAPLVALRDLTVAPEHRCTPYDRDDYPYPQSIEAADRRPAGRHVVALRRDAV